MNEKIYQQLLADMRAGIDVERMLDSCACMGCPIDTLWNGKPSGVQCKCARRCKCQCTLQQIIRQNAERLAENAAMIARAKAEIQDGR